MPTSQCSMDSFPTYLPEFTPRFAPIFIELVSQKAKTTLSALILGKRKKFVLNIYISILSMMGICLTQKSYGVIRRATKI